MLFLENYRCYNDYDDYDKCYALVLCIIKQMILTLIIRTY